MPDATPAPVTHPLATRTWWISLAAMVAGLVLGVLQTTLTDFAKAHPENQYNALALFGVGLIAKALVSHGVSVRQAAAALLLGFTFFALPGCGPSHETQAAIADLDARFPNYRRASVPAPGVNPVAYTQDGDKIQKTLDLVNVDVNGAKASGPTPTATPAK